MEEIEDREWEDEVEKEGVKKTKRRKKVWRVEEIGRRKEERVEKGTLRVKTKKKNNELKRKKRIEKRENKTKKKKKKGKEQRKGY